MPPAVAPASCAVERLGLVEYGEAWALQRRLVEACREDGRARLLLLEHPHTYTLGPRGKSEHLLLSEDALTSLGAAVHRVDRGGDVTYHGPGQLVGYPILDLRRWHQGPTWYVRSLETTLIDALATFDIEARREPGCPGVWAGDAKIASIGVRVSRGITSHGFALNVDPDLDYFSHIVPCGLPDVRVTSMAEVLGSAPDMRDVMDAVERAFGRVFGLTIDDLAAAVRPPRATRRSPLQVAETTSR
ncbi:MAG: lipoyl(octanoyl) transferase LipB [Dehalococcoidia bacterium]